MLKRVTGIVVCAGLIGALGALSARAADTKKAEIKDGIEGKIVKIDLEKASLTIATANGERTFSINDETMIIGPRGGIVHKRLKDGRFHKDLPITVVANGTTAAQLHLGYDRKAKGAAASDSASPAPSSRIVRRTARFRGRPVDDNNSAVATSPAKSDEADVDSEYPGKVKSVDATRHLLVITLLNGHDRSFMLSSDVKVTVANHVARHGLSDPAIKPGVSLMVVTEAGGKKVKEVKVAPAAVRRAARKAS